jgi:hypothetical protein
MYPDSEILFPSRCIRQLAGLRGPVWDELIDYVVELPEDHECSLAFSMLMIKLSSCLTCDLDSYRASLGCTTCAKRTVTGFKGSDEVLRERFEEEREEVRRYLEGDAHATKTKRGSKR